MECIAEVSTHRRHFCDCSAMSHVFVKLLSLCKVWMCVNVSRGMLLARDEPGDLYT